MIKQLIKLANHLDRIGLTKEANYVDALLKEAESEHEESVKKEPWMNVGHGMLNQMVVYHNGVRHSDKKKDVASFRGLVGGPDQNGQGAATLVFYRKSTGLGNENNNEIFMLYNNDGKAIGYGLRGADNWEPHFHKPSNGWPEGIDLTVEKPSSFARSWHWPQLWSLPSPSPAL